jgi:hypothetical protein
MAEISVDGTVLAFAAGVSVASGLLFGIMPGLQAMKLNLAQAMHDALRRVRMAFRYTCSKKGTAVLWPRASPAVKTSRGTGPSALG